MADENNAVFPVVIIGAGLAGLAAGAHLAGRGIAPALIEADSLWPGGRLSGGEVDTFVYDGQTWSFESEHGVHALWGDYNNMRALIQQFTPTILQPSSGEEWINRWGREVRRIEAGNAIRSRWIPAPFHYLQLLFHPQIWANIQPWDFLSLPGFLFSIFLTLGIDPIREKRAWDGLYLKDFFYLWTPNLRTTFEGLATNLLAAPGEQITLTGLIAALRFYTMLRRDSWHLSYLPTSAHTSIVQPLVEFIEAHEGGIYNGVSAQRLEREDGYWRIIVEDSQRGGIRSLLAEQVILALDAPGAARLLQNSPQLASEAHQMIFPQGVGNATVRLWFSCAPREGVMGGMMTGDFTPDNFFWVHRIYEDCRQWHETTGGGIIELHYYAAAYLDLPERNLIIESVTEVQRAFPELKGSFVYGAVRKNSKVHTSFRVPTEETLHVQTPWQDLYACGDWIGYDTPSMWMERSTTTAIAAANAIIAAYDGEIYPILQPQPPELLARILSILLRSMRQLLTPLTYLFRKSRGSAG